MKSLTVMFAATVLTLAACKNQDTLPEAAPEAVSNANESASTSAQGSNSGITVSPLEEARRRLLQNLVVYFDYDQADIRPEFNALLQAHGQFLASNPNAQVRLEGHADERGSREYNIGLGERRAQAVRRVLMLQGATANQLSTVSYGEERPAADRQRRRSVALEPARRARLSLIASELKAAAGTSPAVSRANRRNQEERPVKILLTPICIAVAAVGCSTLTPTEDPVYLKMTDLEARVIRIERVVENQSLIQLASELDQLRTETTQLRGEIETLRFETENSDNRQRELYVDVDRRLQSLEQQQQRAFTPPPAASRSTLTPQSGPPAAGGSRRAWPPRRRGPRARTSRITRPRST